MSEMKLHEWARDRVHEAIKSGRLIRQPCEVCGETKSQAHHDDYSKPLDVLWLCALHHRKRHQSLKKLKNSPKALMTPKQVSTLLGFKPRTISRWCRDGQLKAIKVGRTWRIYATDLEAFLAKR